MRHFYLFILCLFLTIKCYSHKEKSNQTFKKIADTESNLNWMRLSKELTTKEFLESAKVIFEFDKNTDLIINSSETDELGWVHHRIQQTYNGIPIEGAEYIIHEKDKKVKKANGKLINQFTSNTQPSISANTALEGLLNKVNAQKYAWQDEAYENLLKSQKNNSKATFYPTAELVYFSSDFSSDAKDYTLAYKIDVYSVEPLQRFWYYVDAQSGQILDKLTRIHTNCHNGAGQTNYHGPVNIKTSKHGNHHHLSHNCSENDGIATYNSNNTRTRQLINFKDTDNNWNNNDHKKGVEVHWGTQTTYDYFKNTHNRNSFDNNGAQLLSWVNYGINHNNAFWDGAFMTYGDGDGETNGSLTCLDIVAHEITHAITERSAGLVYRGESGALNESFSDIFGTVIEFLYDPNPNDRDWFIAEDANLVNSYFRNMSNPKEKNDPDTYRGDFWFDGGSVHTNSGVQNYWFYLLTEGNTGTNDHNIQYDVQGIGLAKAANIAYKNLTTKLTSYSTYVDAKNGSIEVAEEVYGAGSFEVEQVKNAWCAVGIGNCNAGDRAIAVTSPNGGESISGNYNISWNSSGMLDSVSIEYSLNRGATWYNVIESTENDGSYEWNVPNVQTGIALIRVSAADDFSVRDESNGRFSIQSCTLKSQFTFNATTLCANNSITFSNQTYDVYFLGNVSYQWYVDDILQTNNTDFATTFQTSGIRTIRLVASYNNGCTDTYEYRMYIQPPPTAEFIHDQKSGLNVEFVANQANATSYSWSSNGTNIGNSKMIPHTFGAAGTYNICLSINSPCGMANFCENVQVINDPCANANINTNFNVPATSCTNDLTFFGNTSSGASSYDWYINGEYLSSTINISHLFPAKGSYTVSLKASNTNGCSNTRSKTINVSPNATEINPSNDVFDCENTSATLFAGVNNMQNYQWKLNGDIIADTQNLNVNNSSGEYFIEVTDQCGNRQTRSILIALADNECVWPGDLNYDNVVDREDLRYVGMHFGDKGYVRSDQKIDWQKKSSLNWGSGLYDDPLKDRKHVDANGNGHVDFADFAAILSNWKKTVPDEVSNPSSTEVVSSPLKLNVVVESVESIGGNSSEIKINLNLESLTNDSVAIYGGYFELDLDDLSPLVTYADFSLDEESWFDDDPFSTLYFQLYDPATNTLDIGFTKLDQRNQIGTGKIGNAIIDIINVDGGGETKKIEPTNIQFYNAEGEILDFDGRAVNLPANLFGSACESNWMIDESTPYQKDYKAVNTIQTDGKVDIVNGNTISYKAYRITLNEGFSTKPGAKFSAHTEPCSNPSKIDETNETSNTKERKSEHRKQTIHPMLEALYLKD